ALAEHLGPMVRAVEAFGFDVVLIETVGAGQGDTLAHDVADVLVLLLQPETGDDLQWEKAGLLEVADVIFIHKADLPGAEQVEAQVRAALALTEGKGVPALRGSAKTGQGLEELWAAVAAFPLRRHLRPDQDRDLLRSAQEALATRFATALAASDPGVTQLVSRWRAGAISQAEAA